MAYQKVSNRPLKTNGQQYRLVAITFLFKKYKSFDVMEEILGAFLAPEIYEEKIVGIQGKESL